MTDDTDGMKPIPRIFKFGERTLEDPGRHMTPDEVMQFYSRQYPSLTKGEIAGPFISKGEESYKIEGEEYKMSGSYGTKG